MRTFMDDSINQWAESGPYIWLRYATQYIKDGQTRTVEMSVPIPVGASAETRERLIREAEAGMGQLTSYVEQRGTQRAQNSPTTQSAPAQAQNTQGTQRLAPQPASNTRPTPVPGQTIRPAAVSAPQTSPQPPDSRESEQEQELAGRQNASSSPPRTPARPGESGNNMLLPQFIQYIKENMDLTPKQAMELLNVRSLSTGINLRDAVEQLKQILEQEIPVTNGARKPTNNDASFIRESTFSNAEPERNGNTGPLPRLNKDAAPVIDMRTRQPAPTFDEEVGPGESDENEETFDDLEDLELPNELSPAVLERARDKLSELRESQGAATASAGRLQALNNVAVSQVTEEQLQELADGVWGITALKKLKVDQVEALISWAKLEDDFAEQVEGILVVLEEERYARGNR